MQTGSACPQIWSYPQMPPKTGWGTTVDNSGETCGIWCKDEAMMYINVLDLLAVKLAPLFSLFSSRKHLHIRIMSDSATVLCYNTTGGTKSLLCNDVAKSIWDSAIARNIWISAAHLTGVQNVAADVLSQNCNLQLKWKLTDFVFGKIVSCFGLPDIDLFACTLEAWSTVFTLDWLQNSFYSFSGVASIDKWGGYIHIFMFTDRKNNQFEKNWIMYNINIWICPPHLSIWGRHCIRSENSSGPGDRNIGCANVVQSSLFYKCAQSVNWHAENVGSVPREFSSSSFEQSSSITSQFNTHGREIIMGNIVWTRNSIRHYRRYYALLATIYTATIRSVNPFFNVHLKCSLKIGFFCCEKSANQMHLIVNTLLQFLHALHQKNAGYSALNNVRSAVSNFDELLPVGEYPLVCRYRKGMFLKQV